MDPLFEAYANAGEFLRKVLIGIIAIGVVTILFIPIMVKPEVTPSTKEQVVEDTTKLVETVTTVVTNNEYKEFKSTGLTGFQDYKFGSFFDGEMKLARPTNQSVLL